MPTPTIKNQIEIGDLVELMGHDWDSKSNGIVVWRSLTLYTYHGRPLGGFYDVNYYEDMTAHACYLYKIYWPDGSETMELGDELNTLP